MEILDKVKFIIIHHSGSFDSIDSIKDFHVNEKGWEDVGYHWIIDKNGKLLRGRDEKFIGAHCLNHNENSIGICLIGDFELFETREKQMDSLINFLKKKMEEDDIPLENIFGHREISEKEKICPGKNINLDLIRKKVNN